MNTNQANEPYYVDGAITFDVPAALRGRAVVSFSAPAAADGSEINLVMTRVPMGAHTLQTLRTFLLVESARELPTSQLLESREVLVDGLPGVRLRFAFEGDRGPLEQTVVQIAPPPHDAQRLATVFVFTTSVDGAGREEFEALLRTVRFRRSASGPVLRPDRNVPEGRSLPVPGFTAPRR